MPMISRQVGTTAEPLPVFIQDATVSTGAGLANVVASSVAFSWKRSDQAAVSSGNCSSGGTLGTYSVSSLTQLSSTLSLGWYEFCPPDGVWTSGRSAMLHLYGAPSMAPVPILVELTKTNNQQYTSSTIYSSTNTFLGVTNPVGVSTVTDKTGYGVSSVSDKSGYGVSSLSTPVGVSTVSDKAGYGVSSVADKSGYGVISLSIPVGVSSFSALAGVSTVTDKGGYGVSSVSDKSAYGVSSVTGLNAALLDISVSSRSTFSPTAVMAESYRADGATGSLAQLMYEVIGHMGEVSIVAATSTKTLFNLDGVTSSMAFQLNSSTAPTTITRTV